VYSSPASFVLAFHGCDKQIAEEVLQGSVCLRPSENSYDWLGHGIYFWENDPDRALLFARQTQKRNPHKIHAPAVVGAVVDLGYCLNLVEANSLGIVKAGYEDLIALIERAGATMPKNRRAAESDDLLLRHLDSAVIETVHQSREQATERAFDSVRGVFWEGSELYPNAGFKEKNHIQVCVRNPNCIKGFFRVRTQNDAYPLP
jgi:hypothetical protein